MSYAPAMELPARNRTVRRRITGCLLALAACALLAGCGGGDGGDGGGSGSGGGGGTGEALFSERCGTCHTLAAAGTDASVGPNLDDLAPDAGRVLDAIRSGPGVMPENLAKGEEAQAIADFVAGAAGGGG